MAPSPDQSRDLAGKQVVDLVRMKLTSYPRKDQVHLLDLIGVGLIDAAWPRKFEQPQLSEWLQELLDDPEG